MRRESVVRCGFLREESSLCCKFLIIANFFACTLVIKHGSTGFDIFLKHLDVAAFFLILVHILPDFCLVLTAAPSAATLLPAAANAGEYRHEDYQGTRSPVVVVWRSHSPISNIIGKVWVF